MYLSVMYVLMCLESFLVFFQTFHLHSSHTQSTPERNVFIFGCVFAVLTKLCTFDQ